MWEVGAHFKSKIPPAGRRMRLTLRTAEQPTRRAGENRLSVVHGSKSTRSNDEKKTSWLPSTGAMSTCVHVARSRSN